MVLVTMGPMTDLPVEIDKRSGVPIYVQLAEQIRLLIRRGALSEGDSMPTVRSLAVALSINANTVARVYRDLQNEGLLRLNRGIGTFVSRLAEGPALAEKDFRSIHRQATKLVAACRRLGLTAPELCQLIETLWKEDADVSR